MKKKYVILTFAFMLFGSIYLLNFNNTNNTNTLKENVGLKTSIIDVIQKSNEVDFSKIINFDWDTMYIFSPYSNPKDILKRDGINTYNTNFNIEVLDNITMIGFVNSNKLITFIELPRTYGQFDLTNSIKFSKKETKFSISK